MSRVFIIGAGRSGTNILRDTLTRLPGWETWDCDEINLIWRHGNLDHPHDVFGPKEARPEVTSFLHRTFDRFAASSGADVVLEKTCANSLRVPFIDAVFPEARFIYIVRDGRDVALSAAKRWTASIEARYLLKKLRYAPPGDLPHYAARFLRNRFHQARSTDGRQSFWGPMLPGMADWPADMPLIDVCARQWAGCVDESDRAFASMSPERWTKITYEDLVNRPEETLRGICTWYDPALDAAPLLPALTDIRAQAPDPWARKAEQFSPATHAAMDAMLRRHGYAPAA